MKLSRRDPYRTRRHPLAMIIWLVPLLFVILLVVAWINGGEKPVGEVEIPVPAANLAG